MFGLISLMGDIIYEGARGVIPPYLEFLGATALIVGLAGGFGEFLGYAFRLASGYLADKTKAYWLFIFIGYGLLIVIPLLSMVKFWLIAVMLIIVERIAKGLRAPARDTLISITTRGLGLGKAFGLHELLDQIGAILGPLIITVVMHYTLNDYSSAFTILYIPYIVLMLIVVYAYKSLSKLTTKEVLLKDIGGVKSKLQISRGFWLYTIAVLLNTMGLVHISLILYELSFIIAAWLIPLTYMLVQAIDAIVAPTSGTLYDKLGWRVLIAPFILSIVPSILVFSKSTTTLIIASIIFGVILGMQESIYRAAVADMVPLESRGLGYGIFNAAYGLGFLISGSIFGLLLDLNLPFIGCTYAIASQIVATLLLYKGGT